MKIVQVLTHDEDDGTVTMKTFQPPEDWQVPPDWHDEQMEMFLPSLPDYETVERLAAAGVDGMGGILTEGES